MFIRAKTQRNGVKVIINLEEVKVITLFEDTIHKAHAVKFSMKGYWHTELYKTEEEAWNRFEYIQSLTCTEEAEMDREREIKIIDEMEKEFTKNN